MKPTVPIRRTAIISFVVLLLTFTTMATVFVTATDNESYYALNTFSKQVEVESHDLTKAQQEINIEGQKILVLPPLPIQPVVADYEYAKDAAAYKIETPLEFITVLSQPVANARCHFKSWMDWRSITYRNSRQWRLQQVAYTCEYGFRRVDGLYMIALGSYFLYNGVGDVFEITLSEGRTFRAVVGDVKSDRHTDSTNRFHLSDGSMVEFIVDREVMCRYVLLTRGDISFAGFPGDVIYIRRIPSLFITI